MHSSLWEFCGPYYYHYHYYYLTQRGKIAKYHKGKFAR